MLNLLCQASVGPCNIPEPSTWKIVEHSKWARFVCLTSMLPFTFFMLLLYTLRETSILYIFYVWTVNLILPCLSMHVYIHYVNTLPGILHFFF